MAPRPPERIPCRDFSFHPDSGGLVCDEEAGSEAEWQELSQLASDLELPCRGGRIETGGLFVPKPSCGVGCQRRSTRGLRRTIRARPLLSVAIVTHFVTRSLASRRERLLSPTRDTKSARLGPVEFGKVRDLGRLSCVMCAERFWTQLNQTSNETRPCPVRRVPRRRLTGLLSVMTR